MKRLNQYSCPTKNHLCYECKSPWMMDSYAILDIYNVKSVCSKCYNKFGLNGWKKDYNKIYQYCINNIIYKKKIEKELKVKLPKYLIKRIIYFIII